MKKEIAELWVKDLRTNPPQGKGRLYSGNGHYCCLGRLCLVLGATNEEINEFVLLPYNMMERSGMKTSDGNLKNHTALASLNDNGCTFAEIADIIEQRWEEL